MFQELGKLRVIVGVQRGVDERCEDVLKHLLEVLDLRVRGEGER